MRVKKFIGFGVFVVLIAAAVGVFQITMSINSRYEAAIGRAAAGEYSQAVDIIHEELPDNYRDSQTVLQFLDIIINFDRENEESYADTLTKLEALGEFDEHKMQLEYSRFHTEVSDLNDAYQSDLQTAAKITEEINMVCRMDALTLSSADRVEDIRTEVNASTARAREMVNNLDMLKKAEKRLDQLQKIENVVNTIDGIGTVRLQSRKQIRSARKAYQRLSDKEKREVTNLGKLEQAELRLELLQDVRRVKKLIKAIGTVTVSSGYEIELARGAYDSLSDEGRGMVTNYSKLEKAEQTYGIIGPAYRVDQLIEAIGKVTKKSGDAIAQAEQAYNALSAEQRKHVTKHGVLTAARKKYDSLKKKDTKKESYSGSMR